jgi:hypothetical protein
LTAASRLKQFTLAELAEHAGVGTELTRSFLRRDDDFERYKVRASDGRGRPENLWRLRPDRALEVAALVAEVSRIIGWVPEPAAEQGIKTWQLLRSSLERLEGLALSDDGRPAILQRAEIYLASSEMELRDRVALSQPIDVDEQNVVAEARRKIRVLGALSRAPASLRALLRPSQELRKSLMSSLMDWTSPISAPLADVTVSLPVAECAADLLDMALYIASREQAADAVLVPALTMLSCKPAWNAGTHLDLAKDLEHRISGHGDDAFHMTALAAIAAAFDVEAAVEPLFRALSNRRLIADWRPEWRTICSYSLARFARPGRSSDAAKRAAAACNYLLAEADGDPSDLPLLATAALGARHADSGSLLHDIGRVLHSHRSAGIEANGAMARNLGLAFARDDFAPLQMHIDDLLEGDRFGSLLIHEVSDDKHKALKFSDSNQHDSFVVGAWPQLAQCLGRSERANVSRPLQVKESVGPRLREMMRSSIRARANGLLSQALARRHALAQQAGAL